MNKLTAAQKEYIQAFVGLSQALEKTLKSAEEARDALSKIDTQWWNQNRR